MRSAPCGRSSIGMNLRPRLLAVSRGPWRSAQSATRVSIERADYGVCQAKTPHSLPNDGRFSPTRCYSPAFPISRVHRASWQSSNHVTVAGVYDASDNSRHETSYPFFDLAVTWHLLLVQFAFVSKALPPARWQEPQEVILSSSTLCGGLKPTAALASCAKRAGWHALQ